MSDNFGAVVVCDFEYEVADGDVPNVLCMVAHVLDEHLQHGRTVRLWRGEFDARPPFDVGDALASSAVLPDLSTQRLPDPQAPRP